MKSHKEQETKSTEKRMLRRKEVERRTGFSKTTIYRLMDMGVFPQNVRIGIRAVAWCEQDIEGWIEARLKDDRNIVF